MRTRTSVIFAMAIIFAGFAAGFAQTSGSLAGEELLRALLTEMRLLRVTLQRQSSQQLRGELLLERLRTQQALVRELQREFDQRDMERSRAIMETEDPFEDVLADIENRLRNETDPERKRQIERERERVKRRREMETRYREEARVRQQRNEQRLAEERERLRAIEEEFAKLERDIAAPANP